MSLEREPAFVLLEDGISYVKEGDRVLASCGLGGYAEVVVANTAATGFEWLGPRLLSRVLSAIDG